MKCVTHTHTLENTVHVGELLGGIWHKYEAENRCKSAAPTKTPSLQGERCFGAIKRLCLPSSFTNLDFRCLTLFIFSSMSTEISLAQFNCSLQYKSSLPLKFDKLLEKSAPEASPRLCAHCNYPYFHQECGNQEGMAGFRTGCVLLCGQSGLGSDSDFSTFLTFLFMSLS